MALQLKRTIPSAAAVAVSLPLLLCGACGDSELETLVRFQGGRPSEASNYQAASDASLDASSSTDASSTDAAAVEDDAGEEGSQARPVSACRFRLTTRPQGGRYAPKNIGAMWIARADGAWVKTLALWAGVRLRYLTTYLKANSARDTTDAMTTATLRQHQQHEVVWDLRDAQEQVVPDGDYRVQVEVTDRAGTGQLLTIPFRKSGEALTVTADDSEFFVGVELSCS